MPDDPSRDISPVRTVEMVVTNGVVARAAKSRTAPYLARVLG